MAYQLDTVDVWAGTIADRPGGLAGVLETLAAGKVNLQFVIARRDHPDTGVVFCAPIEGVGQVKAAKSAGLSKSASLRSLRISGPDKAGLGARITRAVADAGVNVRGLSAASMGRNMIVYLAFDSQADAKKAKSALQKALK
jgi:hypothetical protein